MATAPQNIQTWLVKNTDPDVMVPTHFMGVHSDYIPGVTYPANPGTSFENAIKTVRSLDFDPDRGWTTRLCWAAIEQSANTYTWTYLDQWVSFHSGKQLIYVIERTPAFYAKYSTNKNIYPSFPNSSAPPTDWQEAVNLCSAIKARYPNENWVFELWNEPLLPWNNVDGSALSPAQRSSARCTDAWLDAQLSGNAAFFIGSAQDLADGAKALYQAGIRPLIGCAWEGAETGPTTADNKARRVLEADTGSGTRGADWFDGFSYHSYAFSGDATTSYAVAIGCKTLLDDASVNLPMWLTECGHETQYASTFTDQKTKDNIKSWLIISAALGVQTCCLYKLSSAAPSGGAEEAKYLKYYSDPNNQTKLNSNASTVSAFTELADMSGSVIKQAAILTDGTCWVDYEQPVNDPEVNTGTWPIALYTICI